MKILWEYTLGFARRNRRSSIAVMVAVLMVTTMLSALCGLLYTVYNDNLRYILMNTGNWHSELFDETPGEMLPIIEAVDSIENVMIKGQWRTAKIDDPRREYLVWRDANADYWEYMGEKTLITEGRVPENGGEIALSKQYFEHHPGLKMGDTLTLPLGDRVAEGITIEPNSMVVPGEQFVPTGTVELTVVGKLDLATSSTVPAYNAIGFLEREKIAPDDGLTVYMRFKNVRDTYTETPKIAESVGYSTDEYGNYMLRYNSPYLMRLFVFSSEQLSALEISDIVSMPLMFIFIGVMAAAVFVVIIHNAFAMSANSRLTQLGIFASVGATPQQIKLSVMLEAFILSVIPLPIGIVLGQLAVSGMFGFINARNATIPGERGAIVTTTFGLPTVLPAVLLTIFTVWWSAIIPARRVARLSPIAAIRQGDNAQRPKKQRPISLGRLFGLMGELSANSIRARRRSYRTATISLALSFLMLTGTLTIVTSLNASNAVYGKSPADTQENITIWINNCNPQDFADISQRIAKIDGVAEDSWYNEQHGTVLITDQQLAPEFVASGGFDNAPKPYAGTPLLRDGSYRVNVHMVGLEDDSFEKYCATLGLDSADYYEGGIPRTIAYNIVSDYAASTRRDPVEWPYLALAPGDILNCNEKMYDNDEAEGDFALEIGAVTDRLPTMGVPYLQRFETVHFMPMSRLLALSEQFSGRRIVASDRFGAVNMTSREAIAPARARVDEICESYFGSGDYQTRDLLDIEKADAASLEYITMMLAFIVGLFAVIGLSNVWSTVSGNLHSRRREFSTLRSVGMPPAGIRKMLAIEAMLLGIKPILVTLPAQAVLLAVFLSINEVTFLEWLPHAPILPVTLYTLMVLAVITAAYMLGARRLLRENIIDSLKTDAF